MKNRFKSVVGFSMIELFAVIVVIAIIAVIVLPPIASAANLVYTSLIQDGDSDLVRANKQAVAITRLEYGNSFTNITANGTNTITGPVVLDRVVVGTAGATSSLVLSDVTATSTNVVATLSTTAQESIPLGIRTTGNLRAVTTGGTPANITLSYR